MSEKRQVKKILSFRVAPHWWVGSSLTESLMEWVSKNTLEHPQAALASQKYHPDQLKHPSRNPKTQTDTNRHCEMSSNTPRQPSDTPYIHDQVRLEPILHVGKTVKGKIFFTYLFWDIKISKPDYLPFLKMSEFCNLLKIFMSFREKLQFTVSLDHPVARIIE